MSQDITTSRVGDQAVEAQTDQSDNIRKRLGNWTAPMAAQTGPAPAAMDAATVNLAHGTVEMADPARAAGQMTAPMAAASSSVTTARVI